MNFQEVQKSEPLLDNFQMKRADTPTSYDFQTFELTSKLSTDHSIEEVSTTEVPTEALAAEGHVECLACGIHHERHNMTLEGRSAPIKKGRPVTDRVLSD
jgi:hypothetical protein